MKRIVTALVLIPIIVWAVLASPEWAFKAVLAAIGLIAFHEYDQIAGSNNIEKPGWLGMIAGVAFMLAPSSDVAIAGVAIAGMLLALRVSDLAGSMAAAAAFVFGVVYIFGAWRCAIGLRAINPHWLMFALLLSWIGDTAAMYVGRAWGRARSRRATIHLPLPPAQLGRPRRTLHRTDARDRAAAGLDCEQPSVRLRTMRAGPAGSRARARR